MGIWIRRTLKNMISGFIASAVPIRRIVVCVAASSAGGSGSGDGDS